MKKYYLQSWFKLIYLLAAVLFWLGLGVIFHALAEFPVLYFLTKDFTKFSLGFSYEIWLAIHSVFSIIVLISSLIAGIYFGLQWYDFIYIKYEGKFSQLVKK